MQTTDPWAAPIVHPALDLARTPARRSIMDSPFRLGEIPDGGSDRRLTRVSAPVLGPLDQVISKPSWRPVQQRPGSALGADTAVILPICC